MLTDKELSECFARLDLPERARELVREIRRKSPVRKPNSHFGNSVVSYFSVKMGRKHLTLESRTGEYPLATLFEHDPEVLEYWPQPHQMSLTLCDADGRATQRTIHTPNFFVIKQDGVGFVEYRDESRLLNLSQDAHHFFKGPDQRWHYRAAEQWAAEHGVTYSITSSIQLSRPLVDNVRFLQDYFQAPPLPTERADAIAGVLSMRGSVPLRELLESFSADDVYTAIVQKIAFVDLTYDRLHYTDDVSVHRDPL
jgi:putative transposase